MTNADKFLKEGVDLENLSKLFIKYYFDENNKASSTREDFIGFFNQKVNPKLTEDERAILKNIQKGLLRKGIISRTKTGELLVYIQETGEIIELYIFNHLFQFIKAGEEYSIEELLK